MSASRSSRLLRPSSCSSPVFVLVSAVLWWSAGCGEDPRPDSGFRSAIGLPSPAFAVLSSDYKVTSVALFDVAKRLLADDCVRSGATGAVLQQPLSGDAVLPSAPQSGGELVVIDRENAVLTFVDPAVCAVRAQLSVSTGGFKSNPRDIVSVSATKAYVTRYETNPTPSADPADFDEGDDLLIIDPSTATIFGRVALSAQATMVAGVAMQARPDRGLLAGGRVYVTLNNLAGDFSAAGAGRVAVIDPATDVVISVIDLPNQSDCSGIDYVPAQQRLYVSCGGAFSDGPAQVDRSALVEIDLSGAAPVVGRVVLASALGAQPLSYAAMAIVGDTAFIATIGSRDFATGVMTAADALYSVALGGTAMATRVLEGGAYNFGRAGVDAAAKKVFLPDGDEMNPRVRVLDASAVPATVVDTFEPNPMGHLPPREIARF